MKQTKVTKTIGGKETFLEKKSKHKIFNIHTKDSFWGVILLLISISLLFMSVEHFYIGFHNIDLVFNYQNIAFEQNQILYKEGLRMSSIYEAGDITLDMVILVSGQLVRETKLR